MSLLYDVPEERRIRVIVDSDAACEADDPFAIAHALMTKKFDVRAVTAEHFGAKGTVQKSFAEIEKILKLMDKDVPAYMGNDGPLDEDSSLSDAGKIIIEEAHRNESKPLYVLCLGAVTNVAAAILADPEMAEKLRVLWIGGHDPEAKEIPFKEFNCGNDVKAANILMESKAEVWQIPASVYSTMLISLAEIQRRIYPCGEIGRHLFEQMIEYNMTPAAGWTQGESWSLGDSPAVGIAMHPTCGRFSLREAPVFAEDTTCSFTGKGKTIRVYSSVDSRFILEDLIAKLELEYGA